MSVSIVEADRYVSDLEKRMAFHFGNVVARKGPHHFLELTVDIDDERTTGLSMVGMAPMWFLKDPTLTLEEATRALCDVFDAAVDHALSVETAPTVFDLWYRIYDEQRQWADGRAYPPLLWSYGVSMVEQALIDAACSAYGLTFAEAIRTGRLGTDPGRIYPELGDIDPGNYLPPAASTEAAVRHTVGLTDPLVDEDVDSPLNDGLPQTLEEYVRTDGVDHFKIKLSADLSRDGDRLERIASTLERAGCSSYLVTLDANEQFTDAESFREYWNALLDRSALSEVIDRVRYVEQPLPRERALSDETETVLTDWEDGPAVIIDESDDRLDSAGRALDRGYAGTSHKNCKGVFKGVINACLIAYRRETGDGEYVLSGEDLTTIGPVELLQDLAVMGTLGMDHIERNGHHYYRGLSFLPDDIQRSVGRAHPDLFTSHDEAFLTLNIDGGRISFQSVIDAPFGQDFDIDLTRFKPYETWQVSSVAG